MAKLSLGGLVLTAIVAGVTGGIGGLVVGAGGAAAGTAGAFLAGFQGAAIASFIIGGLAQAIAKPAKQPDSPAQSVFASQGRNLTVRQSIAPWQVVLGRARVGGVVTFAYLDSAKKYLHVIVTFACHQCQAFESFYLDDEIVTVASLDASGYVTSGRYMRTDTSPEHQEGTVPGSPYQVTLTQTVNYLITMIVTPPGSTGLFRQTQGVYLTEGVEFTRSGQVLTFGAAYAGYSYSVDYTGGGQTPMLRIQTSVGAEASGAQPFPDLVAESEGKWTNAHRQQGHTKAYFRFDTSFVGQGVPNILALLQGRLLYDPRSATTHYLPNPALALDWFLTDDEVGLQADYATEISEADLTTAANACEQAVSLAAGGTENRYEVNGAFYSSERPSDIIEQLLGAMAGRAAFVSDRWYIFAGVYEAPTVTLSESELAGAVQIQPLAAKADWANGARGVYMDTGVWQPRDFPANQSATYLAADGGEEIWAELDFSRFVTSVTQAQRLAKIELLRRRNAMTLSGTWQLSAYRTMTARNLAHDFARYGWSGGAQVFQQAEAAFTVIDSGDGPALGVTMSLRQDDSTLWDWSTSEEGTTAAAPTTSLPNPLAAPDAPGIVSVTETLYATGQSSGIKSRATVAWVASQDPRVDHYVLYWRRDTATDFTSDVAHGTSYEVSDLEPGVHTLLLFAVSLNGLQSAASVFVKELVGRTAAPSDPTGFAVQAYAGQARFTWDKPASATDLDVLLSGRALVRWAAATSGATWEDGSLINTEGWPAAACRGDGPLLTGTYMLKFRDPPESGGKYSATMASFVVTDALLSALTGVVTVTESPGFTGAKSNVSVVDGALQLVSDVLWDSYTDNMDSWGYVDSEGGLAATGSYTFASTMDTGSLGVYRLYANIVSSAFDANDMWDSRTDNIDDWGMVDGVAIEDAEATLMVRISDDDITYGPWHAMSLVADYSLRYAQFRLDFASANVTHNRRVTTLAVSAKH